MITSMTGFGRGVASQNSIQVTVEIKTLNSRYLDITCRLPASIEDRELALKELVQQCLERGKVTVSVNVEKHESGVPDITFSPDLVKSYKDMLEEMKTISGVSGDVELKDIMQFEDLFIRRTEDPETLDEIWMLTRQAAETALDMTNRMRQKEGNQLKKELRKQVKGISEQLESVIELARKRAPEAKRRLQNRLDALLADESISPERLEQEVAILVDKMDIQEEVIRLESHLEFFIETLESSDAAGRRLNFLCQEINRELNTIGAKANESEISHLIVFAKEKLEQIREQVQNIE